MSLLSRLKRERLYFDGSYGTMFQRMALPSDSLPETYNITHAAQVISLHKAYLEAGCDIIKTNTFGANRFHYDNDTLHKVIETGVENAKTAIKILNGQNGDKYIALDIGPTGKLLKPLGDLEFEDAVSAFAEAIKIGVDCGVDLILIETMNDSLETKAAVIAAKENSTLPVFVTNTYDERDVLVTGASPEAMAALLEGLRVDAFGFNCGFGPDRLLPLVERLAAVSSTPIIVNPNAGLPDVINDELVYDIDEAAFAETMETIAKLGATVLGGCCGTTPKHIEQLVKKTKDMPFDLINEKDICVVSSYTQSVVFDNPVLIGERINPTGKKAFSAELKEGGYEYIITEAVRQQEDGAQVLDVNVGVPGINEKEVLCKAVKEIQTVTDLPLQIDSADAAAMEAALRIYNGKALINSVNGKESVMESVFPLAAKYGGVVIALTLDENGIPDTAQGRVDIAERIIKKAAEYGITKKNIIVDPLALAVSTDGNSANVTLEAIKILTQKGIKTSLGVSNISFGLPLRMKVNACFFAMALQAGLSAAIMNPHSAEMMDVYFSYCALTGIDEHCEKYIHQMLGQTPMPITMNVVEGDPEEALRRAVIKGMSIEAERATKTLVQTKKPLDIVNGCIIPALDKVSEAYETGKSFLPQLLMSAEAAKASFNIIKTAFAVTEGDKKCKIVLATVAGDIHDIGKNIVKAILENYNFKVIDLGKDVAPDVVVDTALKEKASVVGLSALMTTTLPAMAETVTKLKDSCPNCKIVVGGAVLTEEYAKQIGADKYASDAMETVRFAESINEAL